MTLTDTAWSTIASFAVSSTYDANNRRTAIQYPDNSLVNRAYTARDQLYTIAYNGSNAATFAYDNGGRRISRTLGDSPGTVTTWAYTRSDNMTTSISSDVTAFGYTYDANKNKTSEAISGTMANYGFSPSGGTGAAYDNEDRLTTGTGRTGQQSIVASHSAPATGTISSSTAARNRGRTTPCMS